jgi:SAM-dependent methyltransferase
MSNKPPVIAPRDRVDCFYNLLAGGPRLKLLESVMDLGLVELIGLDGCLTQEEIISALELSPHRATKWLYLLSSENFLVEKRSKDNSTFLYTLGPKLRTMFDNGTAWWFYKQFVNSWRYMESESIVNLVKGGVVAHHEDWPPASLQDSVFLENWMSQTSAGVIKVVKDHLPFNKIKTVLDVGGGDGTIACALAKLHPNVHFTVYNLPIPAEMAQNKIDQEGMSHQVKVFVGDFLKEENLPKGFDLVLFTRVQIDWPEDISEKLLNMAYNALNDNGIVAICENFKDQNKNLQLSWEYRYLFWDGYGRGLFKEVNTYKRIITSIGFLGFEVTDHNQKEPFRILQAVKINAYQDTLKYFFFRILAWFK